MRMRRYNVCGERLGHMLPSEGDVDVLNHQILLQVPLDLVARWKRHLPPSLALHVDLHSHRAICRIAPSTALAYIWDDGPASVSAFRFLMNSETGLHRAPYISICPSSVNKMSSSPSHVSLKSEISYRFEGEEYGNTRIGSI